MIKILALLVGLVTTAFGIPAWAQGSVTDQEYAIQNFATCTADPFIPNLGNNQRPSNPNNDQRIFSCTEAIQSGELNQSDLENVYKTRANLYAIKEQWSQALSDDTKAISLGGGDAQIFLDRGLSYLNLGLNDQAIADETIAISIDSQDPQSYYFRSVAYQNKGKFDQAIADATSAITLAPRSADAYIARGEDYGEERNYPKALLDFNLALALDPNSGKALNDRCYFAAVSGSDLESALTDCDRSVQISPGNAWFLDSRGFLYFTMKNYAAAITDYTAALQIDPKIASSLYGLGLSIEASNGNAKDAEADLAAAKSIDPNITSDFGH